MYGLRDESPEPDNTLSVIIPAYNEEENIENTAKVISKTLEDEKIPYELIFVNDGSTDNSFEALIKITKDNSKIKALNFSRNYGKEAAIKAGLEAATGACAAVIDCDLQQPANVLPLMYDKWESGIDIVEGVKMDRGNESLFHKFAANSFYKIMSKSIGINMKDASDYRLIDRRVINILNAMDERDFFFRAISSLVGFSRDTVEFYVTDREYGNSKWNLKSLTRYAITNILSFSDMPCLVMAVSSIISFIASLIFFILGFILQVPFTYAAIFFVTSFLSAMLGMNNLYLNKIYMATKNRPRFIVSEVILDGEIK